MKVSFAGTIEKSHIIRAIKVNMKSRKRLIVIGCFFEIVIVLSFIIDFQQTVQAWPFILFWTILILAIYYMPVMLANQNYKSNKILKSPISGTVDESAIIIASDFGLVTFPWDIIHHARIRKDIALVFTSKVSMQIIPRSFFEGDDGWTIFIKLLKANTKVK